MSLVRGSFELSSLRLSVVRLWSYRRHTLTAGIMVIGLIGTQLLLVRRLLQCIPMSWDVSVAAVAL